MDRPITRLILIIILLVFASIACVNGGDGTTSKNGSLTLDNHEAKGGPNATATYGAEQFHLQLTAVARPGP